MLGLAQSLPASCRSVFVLFADHGKSDAFRRELQRNSLEVATLANDTPRLVAMVRELTCWLRECNASILCCHGYKADVVGLLAGAASRCAGDRHVARLDGGDVEGPGLRGPRSGLSATDGPRGLRLGGAGREGASCRGASRPRDRHPQRGPGRAVRPSRSRRTAGCWRRCFPRPPSGSSARPGGSVPRKGSASWSRPRRSWPGRIPASGSSISATARCARRSGDGSASSGWSGGSSWPGFRDDLDRFLPHWDLSVLPSFTEGLPTVVLESYAAGVPVVATAVGGTPEAVADGVDGYLVPPGDPAALARRILDVLGAGGPRSLPWAGGAASGSAPSSLLTSRATAFGVSARAFRCGCPCFRRLSIQPRKSSRRIVDRRLER